MFKEGDLIRALSDDKYVWTNSKVICKVVFVINNELIVVNIINDNSCINFEVLSKHFAPLTSLEKELM